MDWIPNWFILGLAIYTGLIWIALGIVWWWDRKITRELYVKWTGGW